MATANSHGIGTKASTTPTTQRDTPSFGRISTLESLREHLQWAIELEHSTIAPYLCALYSLDAGRNPEATEVLTSVVVEEMLHMTLAANLLNAVGERPRLDNPKMLPGYPRPLPHGDRSFEISLCRFGREAIETFLKIEQPSPTGALPEGDNYETIGQFWLARRDSLVVLHSPRSRRLHRRSSSWSSWWPDRYGGAGWTH